MRVLLAEDDGALRNLFRQMLTENFEVVTANNGTQALKAMEEQLPDLLLLDLEMPETNGLEVLAEMRKRGFLSQVPVVVLSNVEQMELITKAIEMGAKEYLKKAEVEMEDLKGVCEKYRG